MVIGFFVWPASAGDETKQWLYRIHHTRPGFAEQSTPEEDKIMGVHFQYLKKLTDEGVVLLAGPCLDYAMGIVIFGAASEAEALKIMQNDPSVKAGVMAAELHPFQASLVGDFK